MSLTSAEWTTACEELHQAWNDTPDQSKGWENVKILTDPFGPDWLRIIKVLPKATPAPPSDSNSSEVHFNDPSEDQDDEALPRTPISGLTIERVHYDLIFSPSYSVPVVYLTFPGRSPPSADEIYPLLLASQDHLACPPMQATGPMGALSMTDHPQSRLPAYFVHPCRTAEAMQSVTGAHKVDVGSYFLAWLGLVGGGVGLVIPVGLAQHIAARRPSSKKESKQQ